MRKNLLTLFCALCALSFIPSSVMATDYTIEPKADGAAAAKSRVVPLFYDANGTWGSVTQQIYLASELTGQEAGAGDINAITFYYSASSTIYSNPSARDIQIFLMEIPAEQNAFDIKVANAKSDFLYVSNTNKTAGTRVYNGALTTEAVTSLQTKTVKINFDDSFPWDGSSNLVLTVFDMSTTSNTVSAGGFANIRFLISKTETPRFLSWKWYSSSLHQDDDDRAAWIADMSNNLAGREGEYWSSPTTVEGQTDKRSYVNKVDLSITPAAVPTAPATPEDLAASPATTSASISWSAVSGATSYDLQQSANGEDWSDLASSISGTSYSWTGLSASTTYHVRVRAVNAVGNSDWSDGISFTTDVASDAITYKDITFNKYEETNSLPTSGGNYYLANNITLSSNKTITGDLKLCLNGHTIYTVTNRIIVDNGATLTLYNNESEGLIYGGVETSIAEGGVIDVEDGGTLIIPEGRIENIADASYGSYAVLSAGTLKISGSPELIGESASIYLYGTGKVITIEEGKPLTNTTPYAVNSTGQTITSGWANMSGANPCRFFTSAKPNYSAVAVESNEVKLVQANLKLVDSSDNDTKISEHQGVVSVLAMTRSLTSAQYNTICLPFALSSAQLEEFFGASYDLEEFVSSSLEDDVLSLTFAPRYSLTAGKPYLLKPDWDIINPTFENVTISVEEPVDNTSDANISFHGTFSPTELAGGNKNLLFLGAGNELFYPASTANIKAFRAYFELKGAAVNSAPKARIVKKQDSATGLENDTQITNDKSQMTNGKFLKDGQLYILREGKMYNVLGMEK